MGVYSKRLGMTLVQLLTKSWKKSRLVQALEGMWPRLWITQHLPGLGGSTFHFCAEVSFLVL
ncbi:hypothetical protein RHGRI_017115 [Rhododendron griersonianum]|uniref:Uncharacterized protein n=1 Tax=Rhododendron griersonianum TaxID=479676 RepID=A0AAV6JWQ8_9ERIC|nr:hypothetical protein RHGRI_017115 [Rhododendron griersonianum]